MGFLLAKKSQCAICQKVIDDVGEAVSFQSCISNRKDPLYFFSDACFHKRCFEAHPLASEWLARLELVSNSFEKKRCTVCGQTITNPDEYFTLDFFSNDVANPLNRFNLLKFHRSCLKEWPEVPLVLSLLGQLKDKGDYVGPGIDYMITGLTTAAKGNSSR